MGAAITIVHKKISVQSHAACERHIYLGHPAANSVRIKLVVPCAKERVREVNAAAVATDLHHLRATVQSAFVIPRMRCAPRNAAEMYRPHQLGIVGIGNIVLPQLSCAPAGGV